MASFKDFGLMSHENLDFDHAEQYFGELKEQLQFEAEMVKDMHVIEDELLCKGRELSRRLLQGYLTNCGNGKVNNDVINADNIKLTHKRIMKRQIHTLFGTVEITRQGYSFPDYRSLYPLDAALNLPSGSFSYPLQKILIKEIAKGSIEEALDLVQEISGIRISKGKAIDLIQYASSDFDDFYISNCLNSNHKKRSNRPIMVLTTDGKGVVMRPEGLREGTRKRRKQNQNKHKTRLSKGEKRNAKRMAQVASIYHVDRFVRRPKDVFDETFRKKSKQRRPKPVDKRVWASVLHDASTVIDNLVLE